MVINFIEFCFYFAHLKFSLRHFSCQKTWNSFTGDFSDFPSDFTSSNLINLLQSFLWNLQEFSFAWKITNWVDTQKKCLWRMKNSWKSFFALIRIINKHACSTFTIKAFSLSIWLNPRCLMNIGSFFSLETFFFNPKSFFIHWFGEMTWRCF